MKLKFSFLFLSIILAALVFGFIADEDPVKTIVSKLEYMRAKLPQEKVHLHMDKPYYAIGDTVWFKAYVVGAENNQPTGFSKILYVDIINDRDSIKQSLKLPLVAGIAWGDFTLSDSLHEGNYRVRAYTQWMRSFGEEYFFDKTIPVGNALSNNIITDVNYAYQKIGNSEKVEATVNYTDLEGGPIAGKEVTYDVVLDFRNIAKGKGVTDDKGTVKINFTNTQPFILKAGKIVTNLKLGDKEFVTKSLPVKATSDAVDVQFFPEGGNLVVSLSSRVAFKALSANGIGASVSGYVVDKANNKVAEFTSEHAGMGTFMLTPLAADKYTAVVKFADGSEKRIELPKVASEGYVLSILRSDETNIYAKIAISKSLLKGEQAILLAQSNHVVRYAVKEKMSIPVMNVTIPKINFSTGIAQFTLFSPTSQPVAERLVFVQKNDQLKVSIATNKPEYTKREKVSMTLNVSDFTGKPAFGTFSIAVTDQDKVPVDESAETSILSNLLLTSDIKGYVEKPNYYFYDVNNDKLRHLDNLLMTQGWRRFAWRDVMVDIYPAIQFPPDLGNLEIMGRVITGKEAPVVGGKVTLLSATSNDILKETITDSEGRFAFNDLSFKDSTKFVIQARTANDKKNVEIQIGQLPPQLVTKNKNNADVEVNINRSLINYIKNSERQFEELKKAGFIKRSIVLKEVKVIDKSPAVKNSSNYNGPGNADGIVRGDQLADCLNLAQCLDSKAPGVVVRNNMPYLIRNISSYPMQVILDGMYVQPNSIAYINPRNVESIEVLKNIGNTAIYGSRGNYGILLINSRRRDVSASVSTPGVLSYTPKGFYVGKEFYAPRYDNPATNTQMADLRSTIYWNPNVITDKNGNVTVEFFNSDGIGTYRIVAEGLSSNGELGRQVYTYPVQLK